METQSARSADDSRGLNCILVVLADLRRAFGSDTEAGRLLKKLYCGTTKPKISYPSKPRRCFHFATSDLTIAKYGLSCRANDEASRDERCVHPWWCKCNAHGFQNTYSIKTSDRAIKAPSFSGRKGNNSEVHPIDYRGVRRKPFSEIEKEINQIKRQMEAYRTSYIKYEETMKKPNVEKEELQQVFQYSQGTIFPRELLPGSELLDRELSHANALRVGRKPKDRVEQLEELYDSVLEEIETRKTFMSEMIALGKPDQAVPMEREILGCMSELRKIHQLMLKEKQKDNNAVE